ncbi:MAG: SLC13 family permease [Haloarculaceae archaeon]
MPVPPVTTDMLVVFGLVGAAVLLFVTEALPPDTTAIALVVALVVLGGWTGLSAGDALSGFSSPATVTIVAMYVLSAGVRSTGAIRRLGARVAAFTHGNRTRLFATVVGLTGPLAGFVNNTPVVAMFIPLVTDLADDAHVSPSKLLIPLSYASMLGGTLTLVGTATNFVASDISAAVLDHPFTMFEFTPLGVVVLLVGSAYLVTVGRWLTPERIPPAVDLTAEFELEPYLSRVYVRRSSPLVGRTVEEAMQTVDVDLDVLQIVRGDQTYITPGTDREIRAQDVLTLRGGEAAVEAFVEGGALRRLPRAPVTEDELADPERHGTLVEASVATDSGLAGGTVTESRLRQQFDATVLAIRSGGTLVHERLGDVRLAEGDGLLLHTTDEMVDHLVETGDLVVTEIARQDGIGLAEADPVPLFETRIPLAVGIVAAVVATAALGALPIVIAALGGVVAMIVAGILRPSEAYDAVNWEVVFLLAGVLPLGLALQRSGGAEFLGALVATAGQGLPPLAVVALVYLLTGLLASLVTPVATVALLLPVAIDAARGLGADPFAFVLAVTFAASTAFVTPIGYQTNLMVYSAGGYRFTDYVRVGAPLQLLLAVVTTVGIDLVWTV